MRWGSILLAAVFIMIAVGTLITLIIQGPARVGPVSGWGLIAVSILMLAIAAAISLALIVGDMGEERA